MGVFFSHLAKIQQAREDLRQLITTKNCAPIMLRLAWHDAGTYDVNTKTGGPNGSIRNDEELKHSANNGLKLAIELCEEVKKKYPDISYADLYQLAGVVAVEVTGGPIIWFFPGRKDSLESPEEGRLPNAKQGVKHLRYVFYRMGLTDKDIVALSGAQTLGGALEKLGLAGTWPKVPHKFDNFYFVELLIEEKRGLLKLRTDKALLEDPSFRTYVELYARDQAVFFRDYAISHKKLSELGFIPGSSDPNDEAKNNTVLDSDPKVKAKKNIVLDSDPKMKAKKNIVLDSDPKMKAKKNTLLTQIIMIIAVAAALVVLSYFFEVNRRVK